jgi:hypothetical protein
MHTTFMEKLLEEGHSDGLSVDGYNDIKTNFCMLEWKVVDGFRVAE